MLALHMFLPFVIFLVLQLFLKTGYAAFSIYQAADCDRGQYLKCLSIADPLIREPNLIFPDNMNDIDSVCRTWNQFVDCLKLYTDECFTDQQRRMFNKAVENPIESVHQMCTLPKYQVEYLKYATCIKSTITENAHCGAQYSLLVEQVAKGEAISKTSLCCSHFKFKQCVVQETKRLCDKGQSDGSAVQFASQIIDKALSFLQEHCHNYTPTGECPTSTTSIDQLYTGNQVKSTWSSASTRDLPASGSGYYGSGSQGADPLQNGNYPGSYQNERDRNIITNSKDIFYKPPNGEPIFPARGTEMTWMMPTNAPKSIDENFGKDFDMPSGRTRPSSYGRSSGWTPTPAPATTTEREVKPDWATVSPWHSYTEDNKKDMTTETAWYPAAGSYAGNSIDEPNQQGLAGQNSGTSSTLHIALVITTLSCIFSPYITG